MATFDDLALPDPSKSTEWNVHLIARQAAIAGSAGIPFWQRESIADVVVGTIALNAPILGEWAGERLLVRASGDEPDCPPRKHRYDPRADMLPPTDPTPDLDPDPQTYPVCDFCGSPFVLRRGYRMGTNTGHWFWQPDCGHALNPRVVDARHPDEQEVRCADEVFWCCWMPVASNPITVGGLSRT